MTSLTRVTLEADSRQIRRAANDVRDFGNRGQVAGRQVDRFGRQTQRATQNTQGLSNAARTLTRVMASLGIALSARQVIGEILRFEESMASVKAVTNATAAEMDRFNKSARELGASTRFSASQVAEAFRFLGMAGFSVNQSLESINTTLQLATASGLELGRTADIVSNILSGFGLRAEQASRAGDVLASTASNANTNIEQLGDAMGFAAPVAASLSIDIETTSAAIAALSNAGIQGRRAGTGLRTTLLALASPSNTAEQALRGLGLSVEDVSLESNTLSEIFQRLDAAGLDAAAATDIFGREASSASLILASTASQVEDFTEMLNMSEGELQRMSDTMDDTLMGSLRNLNSAFNSVSLNLGDEFMPSMRGSVDALTALLRLLEQNTELLAFFLRTASALVAIKLAKWLFGVAAGMTAIRTAGAFLTGPAGLFALLAGGAMSMASEFSRARRETADFGKEIDELTQAQMRNELQVKKEALTRLQNRRNTDPMFFETDASRRQEQIHIDRIGELERGLMAASSQMQILERATQDNAATQSQAEQDAERLKKALDFRESIDPLFAIERQFNRNLVALNEFKDDLELTDSEFERLLGMIEKQAEDARKALKDTGDEAKNTGDDVAKEFERAAMQIEGAFANTFEQIFRTGEVNFANLASNILDIYFRMIAEMAAQEIITPMIQPVMGSVPGMPGGSTQATGGGVGFSSPFGTRSQGTTSISGGAPPDVRGIGPAQGTGAAPSAAGMAVAGIGGGMVGGEIGGETGAQLGSIGATVGMAMGGPLGAAAGAVIGGVAGRVFGKSESTTERLIKAERELIESRADAAAQILINENRMDDATRKRERELRHVIQLEESLSESNRERLEEVFALEEMAMRLQEINRINDEREQLERRFLETIGDTTALRQMELDATEAANRGILRFIFTLEDAAAKVAQAEANARQAFNLLQESIRREQAIIEQQFQAPIRAIGAALDRLESRARAPLTRTARDQAMSVLQMARSQGIGAISQEELDGALQVVSEPSERLFSSFEDYQRDFTRTRVVLEDILDETESTAEKQLAQLTSQLEQGERMINALFGIDDRVLSVADAMQNLQAAVSSVTSARADLETISSSPPSFTPRPTPPSTLTPGATDDPLWESILGNQFQAHIDRFGVSWHTSRTSEAERQAALAQMQQAYMRAKGFADGGVHTGGMRIVGERGPELEATGPSRIMSHEDMMKGLRGDNMVAELRSLKEEVAALRSEQSNSQYQIAKNTKRTRDTLEKFDIDGLPPERT